MTAQLWVSLVGALSTPIATVIGFVLWRKVEKVHGLVNNQLDKQLERNDQLTRTLTAEGVDVPARPAEPRQQTR